MEILAGIFVMLVTTLNSVAPQTNIADLLGVTTSTSIQTTAPAPFDLVKGDSDENTSSGSAVVRSKEEIRNALREAKEERETARARIEAKRAEMAASVQQKREEIKNRLEKIKDERKQKIVENIEQGIKTRNDRFVDHWNNVLDRLTSILAKIENRANRAQENGSDIAGVLAAIDTAEKAISDAQGAVTTQAGKIYEVTITTDSNLGQNVSATLEQFRADLRTVLSSVKKARESVVDVLQLLAKVRPDESPTPTP